ncbi:MAG: TIGR03619 family F420-dependent LLM class oxidoreductase [Anaerolineales bacterium]|nr:TIGR03619 family F420-dependent LLM class oxidoreductase [Anaerolineales bacterium]
MKFGVILPNYGATASAEDILTIAQSADRLGFDSAWVTDHVLLPQWDAERFGRLYEALITLAWLAGATSRVRFGVSSLVLPQRNPVIVAKQIATLDALSGGRAMLCVGVGWSAGEYSNLGERFEDRGRRIEEAIEVVRVLWRAKEGEPVTFHGQYYRFDEGVFSPSPMQADGPPIWIGGYADVVLRRAALIADGWHASGASVDQIAKGVETIRNAAGKRTITISARLRLSFDDSDPSAPLSGSTENIIETLHAYQEVGLEYVVIHFRGHDLTACKEAMFRFSEQVIPALNEGTT